MKSLFLSSSFFSRKIVDIVQVFISLICKKKKKKRLFKDFIFNPYENRNKTVAIMIEIFSSTKWICKKSHKLENRAWFCERTLALCIAFLRLISFDRFLNVS